MRTIRLHVIITLLTLLSVQDSGWAQEGDVFSFFDGRTIHLRWRGVRSTIDPAYVIVRDDLQDRTRDTIANADLRRHSRASDIHRLAGTQAGAYFGMLKTADGDIGSDVYERVFANKTSLNFFGAIAATTPAFGRVLGELYLDSVIVIGHSYQYRVIAVVGKDSSTIGRSGVVRTEAAESVPVPTAVGAEPQNQSCLLSWERSAGEARSGAVVSWNVYRSDALLDKGVRINAMPIMAMDFGEPSSRQQYRDEFLTNGRRYFYSLRAVNVAGIESAASPSLEVVPTAPLAPPSKLRAHQVGENVMLEWSSSQQPSIDCYFRVHRFVKATGALSIDTCPAAASKGIVTYIDKLPPSGTVLAYTVQSVCGDEWSATSDTVVVICQDRTPPKNPLHLHATTKDSVVTLQWDRSTESDVVGYNVYRVYSEEPDNVMSQKLNASPVTTTSYALTLPGTYPHRMTFSVSAIDKSYNESGTATTTIRLEDKTAPPTPIITDAQFRDSVLVVAWSRSDVEDLREYVINIIGSDGSAIHRGNSRAQRYETIIHPKGAFQVRISAIDSSGNESAASDPRSFDVSLSSSPSAPVIVDVHEHDNSIVIRWQPSVQQSVAGYGIWRVESDGTRVSMKELPASATEFVDEVSDPASDQHYIIRAFTAAGLLSVDTEVRYHVKK